MSRTKLTQFNHITFKVPRKRSSGENTYMTVQSGSEELTSSEGVYSSVPDSSDNNESLDESEVRNQRKGVLGPLPSLPDTHSKDQNNNMKPSKNETSQIDDENMHLTKDKPISENKQGSKGNISSVILS